MEREVEIGAVEIGAAKREVEAERAAEIGGAEKAERAVEAEIGAAEREVEIGEAEKAERAAEREAEIGGAEKAGRAVEAEIGRVGWVA